MAGFRQRMAAEQSPQRQARATEHAIAVHGFHSVFRTRGNKAARVRQHGREVPFISAQGGKHNDFHKCFGPPGDPCRDLLFADRSFCRERAAGKG